jgi:hypothetical protein
MTERLNVEGHGTPFPNPEDQPTEEIPVITDEMIAQHEAEQQPPSRLRKVGKWLLDGLAASGGYGYGSARMGIPPPPRPPKAPEIKTETDDDEETL